MTESPPIEGIYLMPATKTKKKRLSPLQTKNLQKLTRWLRRNPEAQTTSTLCRLDRQGNPTYCIHGAAAHVLGLRTRTDPNDDEHIEFQLPGGGWESYGLPDQLLKEHLFDGIMNKPLLAPASVPLEERYDYKVNAPVAKTGKYKLAELISLNDEADWTFKQFADWFSDILEKYGTKRKGVVAKKVKYPKPKKRKR